MEYIPDVVFGLLSRLLALVPTEAVLLVLGTALLDAGFPPAIAAKRSSLLFTWRHKNSTNSDNKKIKPNSKRHLSALIGLSHDESCLRQGCSGAGLGCGLSGPGGSRGLPLPSISAHLTHRWPDRLLHTELSDADTSTAQSVHKGGRRKVMYVSVQSDSSSFPWKRNSFHRRYSLNSRKR